MKLTTTRFGELEVDKKEFLHFPFGILGFEDEKEFYLHDPEDKTLVVWLQSTKNADVAFPVIEPEIFNPQYEIDLVPHDHKSLELEDISDAKVYMVLTIPQDVTKMTANLKAPIIFNTKKQIARQIVLQDNKLNVQFGVYKELKKYLVNYFSDDSLRTRVQDPSTIDPATLHVEEDHEITKTYEVEKTDLPDVAPSPDKEITQ